MPVATEPKRKTVKRKFAADVPFTKTAESETGDLELRGYASTWVQDRDGDWMAPDAFDKSLGDYLAKNPILLHQHNMRQPLGSVDEGSTDNTGLYVVCTVPMPAENSSEWKRDAYNDIKAGTLRTFSVGGYFTYDIENWGEEDEKWIIAECELLEISVVSIPSNPDSIFEAAVKALKADDGPPPTGRMADKAFGQMLQLLGIEDVTDPDLIYADDAKRAKRYRELSALYERVNGRPAPTLEAYRELTAPLENADVDALVAGVAKANEFVEALYAPPSSKDSVGVSPEVKQAALGHLEEMRDLLDQTIDVLVGAA